MCGTTTCPIHTRTDVTDAYTEDHGFRAVNYVGEVAVVTAENPKFSDPMGALLGFIAATKGGKPEVPSMFLTLVVKVGEGAIGEVMDLLDDSSVLLLEQTHGDFKKVSHLPEAEQDTLMTTMATEGHTLVLDQVKGGMFASE